MTKKRLEEILEDTIDDYAYELRMVLLSDPRHILARDKVVMIVTPTLVSELDK